jgi:MinD-like ATPase involved in chromosome partitioning or flagellar assembly
MKTIAIHSYKGGTGKTSIAVNLAVIYAIKGKNVCILDYDFRAPSLQIAFKEKPRFWLNDFLEGNISLQDALIELSNKYNFKGKLLAGFANPNVQALRSMMTKDRVWEMRALHKTLSAKRSLNQEMGIDILIFDTSPGMIYSSINALASSDLIFIVMKGDEFDLEGTKELINGLYEVLGKKAQIILNKIPLNYFSNEASEKLKSLIQEKLGLPIAGLIPCDCNLLATGGKSIVAINQPNHPFVKAILNIAEKI